ncbi:MAG: hypothetical protein HY700_03880 [Gemmatimonadetes bacterium]|nr:hypothetical protein [Gemmatimonadota bacterium]
MGEEIADELVNWFNQVDAASRSDLREFNELNFSRFDAKLEQRLAEHHAKLDTRIERLDAKIDRVAAALEHKVGNELFERRIGEIEAQMERRFTEHGRYLFYAWLSLLIPIIGLWMRR